MSNRGLHGLPVALIASRLGIESFLCVAPHDPIILASAALAVLAAAVQSSIEPSCSVDATLIYSEARRSGLVLGGPMLSFEVRQTLDKTAVLALVAVALPYAGFSQPDLESAATDPEQQLVEQIQAEQAQNGPHSEDLIQPWTALALLYQERGNLVLGDAAIEQALQVIRANYGLHALDQVPLIRQKIEREEARGDFAAAWHLEQELLTLARRHPKDIRAAPIFREIADKRMDVLRQYLAGEFPPQIVLGCYYDPLPYDNEGSCTAGSRGVVIRSIRAEAQRTYEEAIRVMLRNELYSSDELRELEMELVRSSYQGRNYTRGMLSLRRLLSYDVANSEPLLTRVNALVQMADWALLFANDNDHREAALDIYEQAYEQLNQQGIAQASIAEIFAPTTPVVLPTFLASPLAPDGTQDSARYVDVAFDVTKNGRSRRVEVLDTTNADDAAADQLVRTISRSLFRPRITNGRFADTSSVVARYYLNE